MGDALRVVAHLDSMLAGDAPHLDALLVYVLSRLGGKHAEPGYKVDRKYPCPDTSQIALPVCRSAAQGAWVAVVEREGARVLLGPVPGSPADPRSVAAELYGSRLRPGELPSVFAEMVARISSPVLDVPTHDGTEHIAKRIGVEYASVLAPSERKVVTTTNQWTKSYRLPLRIRRVARVAWLCVGNRREILKALKIIPAIGKKVADGYGRVSRWECERLGEPPHRYWPWWVDSPAGPVLMRPMPAAFDHLPAGLLGAKSDFGACVDPYWHSDRYTEILSPCD